jgi:hypothetical protein
VNLSEFKAWFEGFTESMDGPPDEKRWARIRERVAEIKDAPPSVAYYPAYPCPPYWWQYGGSPIYYPNSMAVAQTNGGGWSSQTVTGQSISDMCVNVAHEPLTFQPIDPIAAFRDLGRAEAGSLA